MADVIFTYTVHGRTRAVVDRPGEASLVVYGWRNASAVEEMRKEYPFTKNFRVVSLDSRFG